MIFVPKKGLYLPSRFKQRGAWNIALAGPPVGHLRFPGSGGLSLAGGAPQVGIAANNPGQAALNLVTLDNFATLRNSPVGDNDPLWGAYNGAVGDAGPNQVTNGVNGNTLDIDVPSGNIFYAQFIPGLYSNDPLSYVRGNIVSGTWNANINRIRFMVKSTRGMTSDPAWAGNNCYMGTYYKTTQLNDGAYQGDHFYHDLHMAMTANKYVMLEFTQTPTHQVGGDNHANYAPISNYYDRETRWYITMFGDYNGGASNWRICPVQLFYDPNSPDTEIRGIAFHHSGTQYKLSACGPRDTEWTFNVRARYDGVSMRSAGFSTGTLVGTMSTRGDTYTGMGLVWTQAESSNGVWVAIQRQGQVTFREFYYPANPGPTNSGLVLG